LNRFNLWMLAALAAVSIAVPGFAWNDRVH
jgi:hypothetical protein